MTGEISTARNGEIWTAPYIMARETDPNGYRSTVQPDPGTVPG
jgi:hypothetical protein